MKIVVDPDAVVGFAVMPPQYISRVGEILSMKEVMNIGLVLSGGVCI